MDSRRGSVGLEDYEKGDKMNFGNYRGLALLNVCYKILTICLLDRIKTIADRMIGEYLCIFRSRQYTVYNISILW